MLRQRSSFEGVCDDGNVMTTTNNQKSPYPCYSSPYQYPRNCHENLVYVIPSDSNEPSNGMGGGNNNEPVTKNAGSRWREDETEALVEIWRNKICQTRWWKQSKGVRVNKEMWEEIATLLADREVYRTPAQCQIRMKNLLQFYRQAIDNRRSEKSWEDLPEYFDIVDQIMTRKDAGMTSNNLPPSVSSNMSEGSNHQELSSPPPPPSLPSLPANKYHHVVDASSFEQETNKDHIKDNLSTSEERKPSTTTTPPPPVQTTTPSSSSGIRNNKRHLSNHSDDEYNGGGVAVEMDHHNKFYPHMSHHHHHQQQQPPRKIQAYTMKNEYNNSPIPSYANNYHHQIPSPYHVNRIHRESSSTCNGGSCCSSKPNMFYSRKMGLKEKHLVPKEIHSEFPLTQSVPIVEQNGMMKNHLHNIASNPSNEDSTKNENQKQRPCNYYTTSPQGHHDSVPPPNPASHHHHHNMQVYRGSGGGSANEALHKNSSPSHLVFNENLLQLQYKQMETLIEIEKKRLEIEEGRMREEKEAISRTSAYLLEAVKILAETFQKDNNNSIGIITRDGSKLSPSVSTVTGMNSFDEEEC